MRLVPHGQVVGDDVLGADAREVLAGGQRHDVGEAAQRLEEVREGQGRELAAVLDLVVHEALRLPEGEAQVALRHLRQWSLAHAHVLEQLEPLDEAEVGLARDGVVAAVDLEDHEERVFVRPQQQVRVLVVQPLPTEDVRVHGLRRPP